MPWVDVCQNSDEWLTMRAGKVTGSAVGKIMANYGKAFGEPAKKLAVDIAIERITGNPVGGGYSTAHMERGHEQEPIARQLYEDTYFCDVTNGGFFDNGKTGCSPDGLIGGGLIEIKSVIPSVQYETIRKAKPDPKYRWQIAHNLRESGFDWIDYVSYCADFPKGKQMCVYRMTKEELADDMSMLSIRLEEFEAFVSSVMEAVINA